MCPAVHKRPARPRPPTSRPLAATIGATCLSGRASDVLREVIDLYLSTGEPVGSQTVADAAAHTLSPATVRVVLSELADLGLLHQPHPSAGRVPTASGMRVYVDALLRPRGPSSRTRDEIDAALRDAGPSPWDIVAAASQTLSARCELTTLARRPRLETLRLRALSLLRLSPQRLLAIVVFDDASVRQRTIESDQSDAELIGVQNLFEAELAGRTLAEARTRIGPDASAADELVGVDARTRSLAAATLPDSDSAEDAVLICGRMRLVDRGVGAEHLELLRALEDKQLLLHLLDDLMGPEGVQVILGDEAASMGFSSCTVVAAPYFVGAQQGGTVAIVGPVRLEYARVIPLVTYTAGAISGILRAVKAAA